MKNKSWIKILLTSIFLICFGVIGNAQTSAPHLNQYLHKDTDGEMPYRNGNLYKFLPDRAVIDDDFYGAYGIDVSSLTPLKRKIFTYSILLAAAAAMPFMISCNGKKTDDTATETTKKTVAPQSIQVEIFSPMP